MKALLLLLLLGSTGCVLPETAVPRGAVDDDDVVDDDDTPDDDDVVDDDDTPDDDDVVDDDDTPDDDDVVDDDDATPDDDDVVDDDDTPDDDDAANDDDATPVDPNTTDDDGDGWSENQGDCNDNNADLNLLDADGDSATTCDGDCDDTDPILNLEDADADGWSTCDGDCGDSDPALNLDDLDSDGATTCEGDCDDTDPNRSPHLPEVLGDGIDQDCDDTDLLLAEGFDGGAWDALAWQPWSFTSGTQLEIAINVTGDELWSRVWSSDYGSAEESALASISTVDFSTELRITYTHDQPTVDPAIGLTWQSYLAISPDPSTATYVIGNGVNTQANFPPKADLLYVGRRTGTPDAMLFESRTGASQGDGSTDSYVSTFLTPSAGEVELTLDATNATLAVDGTEFFSGPHGLPFTSGYLFFGNYSDWSSAASEATFDDIRVVRPLP